MTLATHPTAAPPIRVEIYDQIYNLRGVDAEYITRLADFVDGKMRTVAEQTSTIDSQRLAVLAALNIADEYHILKRNTTFWQESSIAARVNWRERLMKCWTSAKRAKEEVIGK